MYKEVIEPIIQLHDTSKTIVITEATASAIKCNNISYKTFSENIIESTK